MLGCHGGMEADIGAPGSHLPQQQGPPDDDVPVPHVVHGEPQADGPGRAPVGGTGRRKRCVPGGGRSLASHAVLTRRAQRFAEGGARGSGSSIRHPRRCSRPRGAKKATQPGLEPPERHEGLSRP